MHDNEVSHGVFDLPSAKHGVLTSVDQQKFFGYTEEEVHKKVCMHFMK